MRELFRIFFRSAHANPWTVLAALTLAALAEGIGITTFVPILSMVLESGHSDSAAFRAVANALGSLGIEMTISNLLLLAIVAIGLKGVLTVFAMRHVGDAVARVSTGLRIKLLSDLLAARWSHFVRLPLGRVANAISGDATRAGKTYMHIATALTNALRAVVLVAVAFAVSWRAALFALGVGGLVMVLLGWLIRMAKRAGDRQTKRTADLVIDLTDALNNIKPLKAMHKQEGFARLFDKNIASLRKALRKQVVAAEAYRSSQEFLVVLLLAGGLVLATELFQVETAPLLVIAVVVLQTIDAISKTQQYLQKAVIFQSANTFVQDLIDETEAAREEHIGTEVPTLARGLSMTDVSFSYADKPVLDGLDLEVAKGEVVVITGPSGAGKTTVIDLLLGLHDPDRGTVAIDGVPLARLDVGRWREMIGYVSQELSLFHDSIRANVTLGDPTISDSEVWQALEAAGASAYVESLPDRLESEVGEKGTRLSGGQRQRIALARALVVKPRLLILDEVTSALDHEAEAAICRSIDRLRGDFTIIAITHRPALHRIADRVLLLRDGRLEGAGGAPTPARASLG
jgi:ATP-binding cassette, subfamily C, bacterial